MEQSTDSGAMIGSNDDLLTEILLRVPATSIIRFKSVSKHWQCLLSDRHFTLRYDKLSKSHGLFACEQYVSFDVENPSKSPFYAGSMYVPFDVENPSPPPFCRLDFYPDPHGIKVVQSCNGLLLCCSDYTIYDEIYDIKYYVFNPTTKQFAIIPSLPGGSEGCESIVSVNLAFHPTHCVSYKVVCVRRLVPHGKLFQIQIYSSDTGRWKIYIESFSSIYLTLEEGVYWNGAIHWAPCGSRDHLYFNVDDEQLQSLPFPVEQRSLETLYFGESGGHLHLILSCDSHGYNNLHMIVYELLRDRSGWFVKYRVELHELPGASREMNFSLDSNFEVIDVVRGEKEEDTLIVLIILSKIITYHVHDKSFKEISELYSDEFLNFHRYIESLSSC